MPQPPDRLGIKAGESDRLLPPPRLRPLEHAILHPAQLSQRLERRDAGHRRLSGPAPEPVYPEADRFTGPGWRGARYSEWIDTKDYRIERNEQEFPRAWVVHECASSSRPVGLSRETRSAAIEEMLYANDRFWHDDTKVSFDPRQIAWVASDDIERDQCRSSRTGRPASLRDGHGHVSIASASRSRRRARVTRPRRPRRRHLSRLAAHDRRQARADLSRQPIDARRLVPAKRHRLVYTFEPAIIPGRARRLGRGPGGACCCSAFSAYCDQSIPCSRPLHCSIHHPTKLSNVLDRST